MAAKGNEGTKRPREFRKFYPSADLLPLRDYSKTLVNEQRHWHEFMRNNFNRNKGAA